MRFGIVRRYEQKLARGAAIIIVGGLAAGCSSQVDRFGESLFTGSAYPSSRSASAAAQPYPGDTLYGNADQALDQTYTGSVDRVVRPDVPVGGGSMQANAQPAQAPRTQAPLPPPSYASSAPVSSAPLAPVSSGSNATPALAPVASTDSRPAAVAPAVSTAATGKAASITVQPGETLYGLSRRFNVPVEAIMAANGMTSGADLRAGQTLTIPAYAGASATRRIADTAPAPAKAPMPQQPAAQVAVLPQTPRTDERRTAPADTDTGKDAAQPAKAAVAGSVYAVASGDTLYGISRKTGVSVADLKTANGLSDGYLKVGQQLTIPGPGEAKPMRVASAAPQPLDTVSTGATDAAKPEKPQVKPAAYTPPTKAEQPAETKDATGEEQEVAALPPDATGIGRLRWPVHGRVISAFGSGGGAGDGIDIGVPEGTPIKAAENGVVIYAGDGLKEFGKTVLVRHEDGLVTVYGYAGDIKVSRGDTVRRGQVIAMSGMSGSADRPKLHFEVRKDAAPVDPMTYLN